MVEEQAVVEAVAATKGETAQAVASTIAKEFETEDKVPNETDEYKLPHEFYDVYKAWVEIQKKESSEVDQAELDALTGRLKAIAFHVMQLRLFSPNEELEDINTADLKYLLVPFLLAEATAATRDMAERLQALKNALVYWKAFANDCQRLKVAHADDLRAIDRSPEDALDAASKRDEKIARFKRSKELDTKVEYLFSKKREVLGDEYQWGAGGSFDEDMERELVLALIGRSVAATVENIASAEQEMPLLEMMMARGGPGAAPPKRITPENEKPFILRIQDKAELMRLYNEMVFQCPHELPTMTLAECAEIEMEQARQQNQAKEQQARLMADDEDKRWYGGDRYGSKEDWDDEQKIYKDRDWDDWKDEHPWGSGNKNHNCA